MQLLSRIVKAVCRRLRRSRSRDETLAAWLASGSPIPPPPAFKHKEILHYRQLHQTETFVETGTYMGDTIEAVHGHFATIYSIELSPRLHSKASKRFRRQPHIKLLCGDSGILLREVLDEVSEPALFWLDAHYSSGVTARGSADTPIMNELAAILKHRVQGHVILIDDARCFDGTGDYPTVDRIREAAATTGRDYLVKVENDVIRVVPPAGIEPAMENSAT